MDDWRAKRLKPGVAPSLHRYRTGLSVVQRYEKRISGPLMERLAGRE
jgi:hypothetical protein